MTRSDQFFHGTTHAIKDGVVRPADDVDKPVSEYSFGDPGDLSQGDHAFAIRNNEGYAWHASTAFHPSLRRARVYEVDPPSDMKPGPWNKDHPDFLHHVEYGDPEEYPPHENKEAYADALGHHQDEWASKSGFPVRKRIDIMPGRQGTFPGISWGRFSERPYDQHMNHPTDEQVQYGHAGHEEVQGKAVKENLSNDQFSHDWHKDPPPHSELREMAGRPQKRWDTLF